MNRFKKILIFIVLTGCLLYSFYYIVFVEIIGGKTHYGTKRMSVETKKIYKYYLDRNDYPEHFSFSSYYLNNITYKRVNKDRFELRGSVFFRFGSKEAFFLSNPEGVYIYDPLDGWVKQMDGIENYKRK
jgi:hypothetical protein